MTGGETIEVYDWKAHGWEGRRGMVIRVTKAHIWVRFSDWSPTDVQFEVKDENHLRVIHG